MGKRATAPKDTRGTWRGVAITAVPLFLSLVIGHRPGHTALHLAASEGEEAVAKLLLEVRADANLRDLTGKGLRDAVMKGLR